MKPKPITYKDLFNQYIKTNPEIMDLEQQSQTCLNNMLSRQSEGLRISIFARAKCFDIIAKLDVLNKPELTQVNHIISLIINEKTAKLGNAEYHFNKFINEDETASLKDAVLAIEFIKVLYLQNRLKMDLDFSTLRRPMYISNLNYLIYFYNKASRIIEDSKAKTI